MRTSTSIWCTTDFVAFHQWPEAPDEVAFLRSLHRHRFGVMVEVMAMDHEETGDNREVEFFILKKKVDSLLSCYTVETHSCERIAKELGERLFEHGYRVKRIKVDEDGENGATLEWAM